MKKNIYYKKLMPRQTSTRASGTKSRVSRSVTTPIIAPLPPQPLQVMTPTAVGTESQIIVTTLMICCLALLGTFGVSMAAGIINLTGQNNPPILFTASQCSDTDSVSAVIDMANMYPSDKYMTTYGSSTTQLKNFDPFKSGTARCQDTTKFVALKDQCYIDIYGPLGYTGSSAVASCAPTEKRCRVMERFAYPVVDTSSSSTQYAVGGFNYLCKNGCMSGACVKDASTTPPVTPVCTDSDSITGMPIGNVYLQGVTTGYLYSSSTASGSPATISPITKNDQCNGSLYLTEYTCSGILVASNNISCQWGCENGACRAKPTTLNCTETDSAFNDGIDYYNKGVTVGFDGYKYSTSTDSCSSASVVQESYCVTMPGSTQTKSVASFTCPTGFGCSNGACVRNSGNKNCAESDSGLDIFHKGQTAGMRDNDIYAPVVSSTDYCSSGIAVQEFFCTTIGASYQNMTQGTYYCPTGFTCSDGACRK